MTKPAIIPHLWYDKEAKEAAAFYAAIFPDSKMLHQTLLQDTPSGDAESVTFALWGKECMAISAGPHFTFNPSISFMVNFDPATTANAHEKLAEVWNQLSEGGTVLMPLDAYPFSEKYGWIQDKFGLSWQLILTDPEGEKRPPIMNSLLFVGEQYGHAEEAIAFYLSVFKNGKMGNLVRYPVGMEPDQEGTVMFADFKLGDHWLTAMDSGHQHEFQFNEAISFLVYCDTQEEIDGYWEQLSAVPEAETCGWLKDKFGISWQIVPRILDVMLTQGTPEQVGRVTKTFLTMKKLDISQLENAYNSEKGHA